MNVGINHYDTKKLLEGHIVYSNKEEGYWNTDAMLRGYPNPFYILLFRTLLKKSENFLIMGDCYWYRSANLAKSGVIPVSDSLACEQSKIYNRVIKKDNSFEYTE